MTQLQFRYIACGGFAFVFDVALVAFLRFVVFKNTEFLFIGDVKINTQAITLWTPLPIGLLLGYTLSRFIVFHETQLEQKTTIVRYLLLVASCVAVSYMLHKFFLGVLHWNIIVTRIIVNILVAGFSYVAQKYFTFKHKDTPSPQS